MVRDVGVSPADVRRLYEAKCRAELEAADALVPGAKAVAGRGDLLAEAVVLKGAPGAADRRAKVAVAGPEGEAASKALAALGFDPATLWFACTFAGSGDAAARARRVRLTVEAFDPSVVVALDEAAAADLAAAFGLRALAPGKPEAVLGRTLLAVGGLEASLGDPAAKAKVWAHFKALEGAGVATRARRA